MYVIETENLTKIFRRYIKKEGLIGSIQGLWNRNYENKIAINNLSLNIEQGEFVGLMGPNGAGKTTLIKMLTGIIAPSSGNINVLGYYPNDLKNDFKRRYAIVMGQKSHLFFELTVNDTLQLYKEIYELPEREFQESKEYFIHLFDVKELMDVQVRTLSLGERMKMELMTALLHNPEILFMDEPTIGLDVIASGQIRNFMRQIHKEKGTSIILTSHYMEDIRSLCERTIVLNHGYKIYDGRTETLFEKYQINKKLTVIFDQPAELVLPENVSYMEDTPLKKIILLPKEHINIVLELIMPFKPVDISVEMDDIGDVVERIYQEGRAADA